MEARPEGGGVVFCFGVEQTEVGKTGRSEKGKGLELKKKSLESIMKP